MRKYRSYTEDFKRELLGRIERGEITQAIAARENDISSSLIEKWIRQEREGVLRGKPTARELHLERELDLYKKKVGELAVQVDLLKKLNEYSASLRKSSSSVVTGKNLEESKGRAP